MRLTDLNQSPFNFTTTVFGHRFTFEKGYSSLEIPHTTMTASDHSNILGIYLLDQFTLLKDQVLEIEILEKNGGRHQKVHLENKDLIHARLINSLT